MLQFCNGNCPAAEALGISRKTLYRNQANTGSTRAEPRTLAPRQGNTANREYFFDTCQTMARRSGLHRKRLPGASITLNKDQLVKRLLGLP